MYIHTLKLIKILNFIPKYAYYLFSGTTPFQVRVHFDAGEAVMEGDPATNIPAGIIGFSLNYALQKCT